MKKYLLATALLISHICFAQRKDSAYGKIDLDSITRQMQKTNEAIDSMYQRMQKQEMERTIEQNNRNLDTFMRMQKEREAKQKKPCGCALGWACSF